MDSTYEFWDRLITGMTGAQRSSPVACLLSKLCCVSWRGRQTLRLGADAGTWKTMSFSHVCQIFAFWDDPDHTTSKMSIINLIQGHLINSINTLELGESECPDLVGNNLHREQSKHNIDDKGLMII